jgi:hypothetical protein
LFTQTNTPSFKHSLNTTSQANVLKFFKSIYQFLNLCTFPIRKTQDIKKPWQILSPTTKFKIKWVLKGTMVPVYTNYLKSYFQPNWFRHPLNENSSSFTIQLKRVIIFQKKSNPICFVMLNNSSPNLLHYQPWLLTC